LAGFEVTTEGLHGDPDAVRKSLQTLIGKNIPIIAGYVKPGALIEDYVKWKKSRRDAEV